VMAIGLNAVREICSRCPLVMNEDLLRDLVEYKNYRDRSVMMAARSLIQLFRRTRPELLHKKDRGRPTEASVEISSKKYGEVKVQDYIPGAEVLLKEHHSDVEINSDSESDDEEWVDLPHSSDEDHVSADETEELEDEENSDDEELNNTNAEENKSDRKILKAKRTSKSVSNEERAKKVELAKQVVLDRILTDEDFKRMEIANAKKEVTAARKGVKRKPEDDIKTNQSELVRLGDIENIYKKRKHDKQTRLETVKRGQVDREKFGYKDGRMNIHCSKTNREKRKTKNFLMLKHKARGKVKRSFKDKQIALRNHLVKQKRMK